MAEITKINKGVILECDCGATHKLTLDENKNIKVKSTYKKKDENEETKTRKPETKKQDGNDDDDDDDSGIFF